MKSGKTAFSMVETMISIIVISIFAAVFTPVLTKKQMQKQKQYTSVTSKCNQNKPDGTFSFGEKCVTCDKDKCLICKKVCSEGTYKDTASCTCKNLDDTLAEVSNCTSYNAAGKCIKCESGYTLDSTNNKCNIIFECSGGICRLGTIYITQYNVGDMSISSILRNNFRLSRKCRLNF